MATNERHCSIQTNNQGLRSVSLIQLVDCHAGAILFNRKIPHNLNNHLILTEHISHILCIDLFNALEGECIAVLLSILAFTYHYPPYYLQPIYIIPQNNDYSLAYTLF